MSHTGLERRRQRARKALISTEANLDRFDRRDLHELIDGDMTEQGLREAENERCKAIAAMVRAGLQDDCRVQIWVSARKALGQRDFLRRTHKGLEKGVRHPMKPDDVLLAAEVSKLTEGLSEERKPERIRKRLVGRLLSLATQEVEDPHIARPTAHRLHKRVRDTTPAGLA